MGVDKAQNNTAGWNGPEAKKPKTKLEKWEAREQRRIEEENVDDCGSVHSGWGKPGLERQISLGLISLGDLEENTPASPERAPSGPPLTPPPAHLISQVEG